MTQAEDQNLPFTLDCCRHKLSARLFNIGGPTG